MTNITARIEQCGSLDGAIAAAANDPTDHEGLTALLAEKASQAEAGNPRLKAERLRRAAIAIDLKAESALRRASEVIGRACYARLHCNLSLAADLERQGAAAEATGDRLMKAAMELKFQAAEIEARINNAALIAGVAQ